MADSSMILPIEREPHLLMKLISNDGTRTKMDVHSNVLDQLTQIQSKVSVVGIVGELRSGKSFFMNILADKNPVAKGSFVTGDLLQPVTKGIWIMVVDHPHNRDKKLMLLDTEGLGDVGNDNDSDNMLFTMTTLLCTHLIFNINGVMQRADVASLRCISDFAKRLQDGATDVEIIHPYFIPFIRNFCLSLRGGTASEYFDASVDDECRKAFDIVFSGRKAFTTRPPPLDAYEMMQENIRELPEMKRFFLDIDKCRNYIWETSGQVLGKDVRCSALVQLIKAYADAIEAGVIPHQIGLYRSIINEENYSLTDELLAKHKEEWNKLAIEKNPEELGIECVKFMRTLGSYQKKFTGPDEVKKEAFDNFLACLKFWLIEKWTTIVMDNVRDRIRNKEFFKKGGNEEFDTVMNLWKEIYVTAFGTGGLEHATWSQVNQSCLAFYAVRFEEHCKDTFRKWVKVRKETLKLLEGIISSMTGSENTQSKVQVGLSGMAIVAAILGIVGVALLPLAGAGAPLLIAAGACGAAAGVSSIANFSAKEIKVKKALSPLESQKEKDEEKVKKLSESLNELKEFIQNHKLDLEEMNSIDKGRWLTRNTLATLGVVKIGAAVGNSLARLAFVLDDVVSLATKIVIPLAVVSVLFELAAIVYHVKFLARKEVSKQTQTLIDAKKEMEDQLAEFRRAFEEAFNFSLTDTD